MPDSHMNVEPAMDGELDPLQIVHDAFQATDEIRLMAVSGEDSNMAGSEATHVHSITSTMVEPISNIVESAEALNDASDRENASVGLSDDIEGDDSFFGETL